jgi:hypothetical protein
MTGSSLACPPPTRPADGVRGRRLAGALHAAARARRTGSALPGRGHRGSRIRPDGLRPRLLPPAVRRRWGAARGAPGHDCVRRSCCAPRVAPPSPCGTALAVTPRPRAPASCPALASCVRCAAQARDPPRPQAREHPHGRGGQREDRGLRSGGRSGALQRGAHAAGAPPAPRPRASRALNPHAVILGSHSPTPQPPTHTLRPRPPTHLPSAARPSSRRPRSRWAASTRARRWTSGPWASCCTRCCAACCPSAAPARRRCSRPSRSEPQGASWRPTRLHQP